LRASPRGRPKGIGQGARSKGAGSLTYFGFSRRKRTGIRALKPRYVLLTAVGIVALLVLPNASAFGAPSTAESSLPRYIIVLKGQATAAQVLQDAQADDTTPQRTYGSAFAGYSANLSLQARSRAEADPNVAMVVPDFAVHLSTSWRNFQPARSRGAVGNNHQPAGLPVVAYSQFIPTALERVFLQDSRLAEVDGHGPDVNAGIAVIDSGITPNPDLRIAGGVDCSDDATADLSDGVSHGTEVAGLAAAVDNSFGVVGTAPGARLYDVKVFDNDGNADLSNLLCGIDWVLAHHNEINVVNMSFEDTGDVTNDNACGLKSDDPFHTAICRAYAEGITLVAGSGNDGIQITPDEVPQAYPEVITVGGYQDTDGVPGGLGSACGDGFGDADDMWAPWTNFGPQVALMAVADCEQVIANDGTIEWDSGTSFAGPAVAGAAADLSARFPNLGPAGIKALLTLTATHRNLGANPYGYGLLDLAGL
jgi:subtilisin